MNKHIQIEVDVIENAVFENWRHIYVAVVISEIAFWFVKAKDVVPPVKPVIFVGNRSASDKAKVAVAHVKIKDALKNEQRPILLD